MTNADTPPGFPSTTRDVATAMGLNKRNPTSTTVTDDARRSEDDWLLCRSASHMVALPMHCVIEIMRSLPIEPIAGAPEIVLGVSIIRGIPTVVIDTRRLLGGGGGEPKRLVLVRTGPRTIALAMESVSGVRATVGEELARLPPLLKGVSSVVALQALDEELVLFLNAARIVEEKEIMQYIAESETA